MDKAFRVCVCECVWCVGLCACGTWIVPKKKTSKTFFCFFLLYYEDGILINDHLRSSSAIMDKTDQHTWITRIKVGLKKRGTCYSHYHVFRFSYLLVQLCMYYWSQTANNVIFSFFLERKHWSCTGNVVGYTANVLYNTLCSIFFVVM